MPNSCGECTMCCKLPGIEEFKPVNKWCRFCTPGKGCNTYNDRPKACTTYQCAFLYTEMAPEMRPDRFGAIFEGVNGEPSLIVMRVPVETYNSIMQRDDVITLLSMFVSIGTKIVVTNAREAKLFEADEKRPGMWVLLRGTAQPGACDPVTGLKTYNFDGVLREGRLKIVPGYTEKMLARMLAA